MVGLGRVGPLPEAILPELLVGPALQGELLGSMSSSEGALACLAHSILRTQHLCAHLVICLNCKLPMINPGR